MTKSSLLALPFLLFACGAETVDKPACPDITGNYTVQSTRVSGTCDASLDSQGTLAFALKKEDDGSYTASVAGVVGFCPTTFDDKTCRLIANCTIQQTNGKVTGTVSADYTFTASGFTGSSIQEVENIIPSPCSANYDQTGTKL